MAGRQAPAYAAGMEHPVRDRELGVWLDDQPVDLVRAHLAEHGAGWSVGTWGAIDLIRDPYSDAASGGLRLTALVTADVTVSRPAQLEILTGVESAAS